MKPKIKKLGNTNGMELIDIDGEVYKVLSE